MLRSIFEFELLGLLASDCGRPLALVLFCAVVVVLPLADGLVLGEALALACAPLSVPVALAEPLGEVLLGEVLEALALGDALEALLLGALAEALPLGVFTDALALEGELDAPMLDALPLPQSPFIFTSCPTWAERSSLLLSLATLPFFSCRTNWPLLF